MSDPLRTKRDDPDAAFRLAADLNAAGVTERYVTVDLARPVLRADSETYWDLDTTGETLTSTTEAQITTAYGTLEIPINGYDEMALTATAIVDFTNNGTGSANYLEMRLSDANVSQTQVYHTGYCPASTAEKCTMTCPYSNNYTQDASLYLFGGKGGSGTNIDIDNVTVSVLVVRRNLQPPEWRQVAFVAEEDHLILRRATLLVSDPIALARNAASYPIIKAGIATEATSRVEYIGDGFNGSKQGLKAQDSVRITGAADVDVDLPKGRIVVVSVQQVGNLADLNGVGVQFVIGRKGL